MEKFEQIDKKLDKLLDNKKINIGMLEDIISDDVKNYQKELNSHIEEKLKKRIDERDLIFKKNKNG